MGIRLRDFITRLRGNPVALSTLLVAVGAAFVGFLMAKPDAGVLAGALIGASVSAVVGLLITFLGEPDIRTVPRPFLEAAKRELAESGYYRSNHRYWVALSEQSPIHIHIIFTSRIVPAVNNARVKPPQITPPSGASVVHKEYKVGRFPKNFDDEFEINSIQGEQCTVTYRIDNNPDTINILRETHRWTSPIDGFTLTSNLPDGYTIRAVYLSGLSLDEEESHIPTERIFSRNEVAFSQQGVTWTIIKA
jgi:hypothetical protein